jgi:hypothetical protein
VDYQLATWRESSGYRWPRLMRNSFDYCYPFADDSVSYYFLGLRTGNARMLFLFPFSVLNVCFLSTLVGCGIKRHRAIPSFSIPSYNRHLVAIRDRSRWILVLIGWEYGKQGLIHEEVVPVACHCTLMAIARCNRTINSWGAVLSTYNDSTVFQIDHTSSE